MSTLLSLFSNEHEPAPLGTTVDGIAAGPTAIDYVPTPAWFAAAMVDRYLSDLGPGDIVLEPTCGDGAILREIPASATAFGCELDPVLAAHARLSSGRDVVVGDVLRAALPQRPTRVIGNPPFSVPWLTKFLDRFALLLPKDGSITLLLPAYALQTSTRIARYASRYSISVEAIPRDIFGRIDIPLLVATFTKDDQRRMIGLAFFHECAEWKRFPNRWHALLKRSERNVYVRACFEALRDLGGRGTVDDVARIIVGGRPTATEHWRAAVRRALAQNFVRVREGLYELPDYASAA